MPRVIWTIQLRQPAAWLGMLPTIISSYEDRVADQLNKRYAHGGGYGPWGKGEFSLADADTNAGDVAGKFKKLCWTDGADTDEPFREVARAETRHEIVYLFEGEVLAIVDKVTNELDVTRVN